MQKVETKTRKFHRRHKEWVCGGLIWCYNGKVASALFYLWTEAPIIWGKLLQCSQSKLQKTRKLNRKDLFAFDTWCHLSGHVSQEKLPEAWGCWSVPDVNEIVSKKFKRFRLKMHTCKSLHRLKDPSACPMQATNLFCLFLSAVARGKARWLREFCSFAFQL